MIFSRTSSGEPQPKANAHCERMIGSVRRECLDHVLVLGEDHLQRILEQYRDYYQGMPIASTRASSLATSASPLAKSSAGSQRPPVCTRRR